MKEKHTCKVSKQSVQNCYRSCAHKTPRVNVDGWTKNRRMDEQTKGWKFAPLSRPANKKSLYYRTCICTTNSRNSSILGTILFAQITNMIYFTYYPYFQRKLYDPVGNEFYFYYYIYYCAFLYQFANAGKSLKALWSFFIL